MWICASCGTQAQRPEVCSGCGSKMRPFEEPPRIERYQFMLIANRTKDDFGAYGAFPSVMAAENWAAAHLNHHDYDVVLMESPLPREEP
jgi:hypothetical protein